RAAPTLPLVYPRGGSHATGHKAERKGRQRSPSFPSRTCWMMPGIRPPPLLPGQSETACCAMESASRWRPDLAYAKLIEAKQVGHTRKRAHVNSRPDHARSAQALLELLQRP